MVSPEDKVGRSPEPEQPNEQEFNPYYLASRFNSDRTSGRVYFQAQELIFNAPDSELSAFRFQIDRIYHVAVVGDKPQPELEDRLTNLLSAGESVTLSTMVLKLLVARRQQQIKHGPWIERHYRPGQQL